MKYLDELLAACEPDAISAREDDHLTSVLDCLPGGGVAYVVRNPNRIGVCCVLRVPIVGKPTAQVGGTIGQALHTARNSGGSAFGIQFGPVSVAHPLSGHPERWYEEG